MVGADRPTDRLGVDVLGEPGRFRTGASGARRTGRRAGPRRRDIPGRGTAEIAAPANATVCQFVPHSLVLGRAACAITHGGMGVTQKALARGVPVCVVPYGRDQFEVARRVEVAKCGTWVLPKDLSASRMRDEVLKAMTMTEGARRVAAGYVASGGAARGASLIEERLLISARHTPRRSA